MLTPEERAWLLERHVTLPMSGLDRHCCACGRDWPCPTVEALGEGERLRAAVAPVMAWLEATVALSDPDDQARGDVLARTNNAELRRSDIRALRAALAGEGAP